MIPIAPPNRPDTTPAPAVTRGRDLWPLAQKLEASFLAEMLKTAGVAKPPAIFGGGTGEDQFSSFLVREYAEGAVRAGGVGLSEAIYRSLVANEESR